jgi:hypothetical protein
MSLVLLLALLTPQQATTLQGTVVAYSPFGRLVIIIGLPPPADVKPFHEDFLVQLDSDVPQLRTGQLVRLKYTDETGTKPERPNSLFADQQHWRFVVTRDDSCDSKLENLVHYTVNGQTFQYMQLTGWTKTLKPIDYTVPCYIVSADGFAKR